MKNLSLRIGTSTNRLVRTGAMQAALASCVLLSGCGERITETDEAAIANQAESLERAANATTDQLIKQINDGAKAKDAAAVRAAAQPAEDGAATK